MQFRTLVTHTAIATATGSGSGKLPLSIDFVTITSANADYIITLPYPALGDTLALRNGATGYELRSHDPANVAINGGTGAAAESAIPAETLVVCVCDTTESWLCTATAIDGTASVVEAAA